MRSWPNSASSSAEAEPSDALRRWFGALAGAWDLERQASDGSSFVGRASFAAAGDGSLLLVEEGRFRPAGAAHSLPAGRHWIWRLTADDALEIRYPEPDGRLYHRFLPVACNGEWRGSAEHPCGADRYVGTYVLGAWRMEIVHDVKGPAKDYRLVSRFVRPLPAPAPLRGD